MKIEVKNVTKTFGRITALKNVDLTMEGPHIYGLLGRNGAGKSTLLSLMNGRLFPTEGEILVDGEPAAENDRVLGRIYCMAEHSSFPDHWTVADAFHWTAELYPSFRMNYALKLSEKFELNLKARNSKLSTGYESVFRLITALASGTPAVFLDEPVLGLDAPNREMFYRELVENFAEQPRLIVLSTHLIDEAANLFDRIILLKSGEVGLAGETEQIVGSAYSVSGPAGAVDAYAEGKETLGFDTLGGLKTVYLRGTPGRGPLPAGLETGKIDLQKLFIELTAR